MGVTKQDLYEEKVPSLSKPNTKYNMYIKTLCERDTTGLKLSYPSQLQDVEKESTKILIHVTFVTMV